MKKRNEDLVILTTLVGVFLITIGLAGMALFSFGYHQESLSTHPLIYIIVLLFVATFIFGYYLVLFHRAISKKIGNYLGERGILEILSHLGGPLLVVVVTGSFMVFSFGCYQQLFLVSPATYSVINNISLSLIIFGISAYILRVVMNKQITEFFKKRRKQRI